MFRRPGILVLLAGLAAAAPVLITDTVLDDMPAGNTSFTYLNLDSSGTSMTASRSGGLFQGVSGGIYPGLWIGTNNASGSYTFSFSAPVRFSSLWSSRHPGKSELLPKSSTAFPPTRAGR